MQDVSGIYLIRNQINRKVYVGQSVHINIRWREHVKCSGLGHKSHLYDAIRKYGAGAFTHEVLEECPPELFDEREAYWMEHYDCRNSAKGYNLLPAGQRGRVMDDACRERIASKLRGRKCDPEVVRRIAEKARGKKHSDETKAKISAAHKGKKVSPESIAKQAAAQKARWASMTEAEREAYAAARRGFTHTEETREKMSQRRKGKPKSEATRARMKEARLNEHPETKARRLAALHEANKIRWDAYRARKEEKLCSA